MFFECVICLSQEHSSPCRILIIIIIDLCKVPMYVCASTCRCVSYAQGTVSLRYACVSMNSNSYTNTLLYMLTRQFSNIVMYCLSKEKGQGTKA